MQLINPFKRLHLSNFIPVGTFEKTVDFMQQLFSKNSLRKLTDQILDPNQSDEKKALSAALGIFVGIIPIWGFQTLAGIFLALVFKLNKALVTVFSQISFPPVMPLIIYLSYKAGGYWIYSPTAMRKTTLTGSHLHFQQYLYGSITLAFCGAIAVAVLTYGWLKLARLAKTYNLAMPLRNPFKLIKKQAAI